GEVTHNECGTIDRPCEASADYCLKIENEALRVKRAIRGFSEPATLSAHIAETADNWSSEAERLGRRRARLVGQLIQELNALKPQLQVPDDDYSQLMNEFPHYEVFKICKNHPSAARFVKLLPDRPRVHSLAFEIAAISFSVSDA